MKIRKTVISLLAMLPISSIAFAAEYKLHFDDTVKDSVEIEKEFLQKLEGNQLPLKYYRFLKKHSIRTSDQLELEENLVNKDLLIEEYIDDYIAPMGKTSGNTSII